MVVVGTIVSKGGTRVTSRDPNDLTREDSNYQSIAQDYASQSRSPSTAGTIIVTMHAVSRVKHGPYWYEFESERIQPRIGSRYVLVPPPHPLGPVRLWSRLRA